MSASDTPRSATGGRRLLLRDVVFYRLRDAIVAGDLEPDEAIVEAEVSEWANASRTPVRQAFDRLATTGFVITGPQRGTVVAPIDVHRSQQSFTMLTGVLAEALTMVAPVLTQREVESIAAAFRAATAAVELYQDGGALDGLVAAFGNPRLRQLWDDLAPHIVRAWLHSPPSAPTLASLEVNQITAALERGDSAAGEPLRAWAAPHDAATSATAAPGRH